MNEYKNAEDIKKTNEKYNLYWAEYHGKLNWWFISILIALLIAFAIEFYKLNNGG